MCKSNWMALFLMLLERFQRKTFVSDGEEGTTTDGDEYLSSLGRNAIRLEEYSAATCFKPDDFDNVLS